MRRRVFAYDAVPPVLTYLSSGVQSASGAHTYAGLSFGAADATRRLVAAIGYSSATLTAGVTIGGVAATKVVDEAVSNQNAEIWIADVPTGASGDLVISSVPGTWSSGYALYSVTRLLSSTATAVSSDTVDPLDTSVSVDNLGVVIAVAYVGSFGTTGAAAWTGVTEDSENAIGQVRHSSASTSVTTGGTVSPQCSGLTGFQAGATASFR